MTLDGELLDEFVQIIREKKINQFKYLSFYRI